jgi:hypothetical protein
LIEFGEELVLGVGDCLGVASCDFGGSLGFADGGFGLRGEKGAVALRVGVALGDGGSDAGGSRVCRLRSGDGDCVAAGPLRATGSVRGEALGDLFFEGERFL